MAIMTLTASAMTFSDVTATDWFADAVYTSVDPGLINGKGKDAFGADYFDPDGYITLSEEVEIDLADNSVRDLFHTCPYVSCEKVGKAWNAGKELMK